ncbi:MAG: cytochrome c peroxidase, partial [Bacteroidota bacterium]
LSANQRIACASCHRQALAFGDDAIASTGVGGESRRHSMRLVNLRFHREPSFFWDGRLDKLTEVTVAPIINQLELGFSGQNGAPALADLFQLLDETTFYGPLFTAAYGTPEATEERIADALAQFIRSLQSFDSKYDVGRAQVANDGLDFPNFTEQENFGRALFGSRAQFGAQGGRIGGGLGCGACHQAPEFSIDPFSGNNGVTASIGGGLPDLEVDRSPTLRDLFQPDGTENSPFMHNGAFPNLISVMAHYNNIPMDNPGLDPRLRPGTGPQTMNMTTDERDAVIAFLRTLSGTAIYTHPRWSNPFPE